VVAGLPSEQTRNALQGFQFATPLKVFVLVALRHLVGATAKCSACKAPKCAADCHARGSTDAACWQTASKSANASAYQGSRASKEAQQVSRASGFLGTLTLFGGWA
jgi:hypothetical protein